MCKEKPQTYRTDPRYPTCDLHQTRVLRTINTMEVQLTPDQKAFVREAIQSGRIHRAEDAVEEALALWEERERARAEILFAVDEAEASLARGDGRVVTQPSMRDLAAEVKQRGRDRLAAEQPRAR
jgi:putative addiction module CopG family antidote